MYAIHGPMNTNSFLQGKGGSSAAEGLAAGEVEPWADEVTTLLLGLVLMSHARYLKTPMFPV